MRTRLFLVVSVVGLACGKPEPVTAPTAPGAPVEALPVDGGTAAADVDAGAGPEGKTLFVREELVDCEGEGPQKCLQVRESEDAEWTLFYGKIEGFTYEPGHAYVLRVATKQRSSPPADAPSRKLRLVEVVSKRAVH